MGGTESEGADDGAVVVDEVTGSHTTSISSLPDPISAVLK